MSQEDIFDGEHPDDQDDEIVEMETEEVSEPAPPPKKKRGAKTPMSEERKTRLPKSKSKRI